MDLNPPTKPESGIFLGWGAGFMVGLVVGPPHGIVFEWPQPGTGGHTEEKEEEGGWHHLPWRMADDADKESSNGGRQTTTATTTAAVAASDKWDMSTPGVIRDGGQGGRHATTTWRARGHGGIWHDQWVTTTVPPFSLYQHNNQSVQRQHDEECPHPTPRQQPRRRRRRRRQWQRRRYRRGPDGGRRRGLCT